MKRKIITTSDGSKTIHIEGWDEQYHSKHGAVRESYHVFMEQGLSLFQNRHIAILEIGFGTGLNALITLLESQKLGLNVDYTGVEAYPVSMEEVLQLDYARQLDTSGLENKFLEMHTGSWESYIKITEDFRLCKQRKDFRKISDKESYDLIFFDAFGARVQPELWTQGIFQKMFEASVPGGVLVTYAAKGSVRRAMQAVGFGVERLPGPPGKREMLRATKK